MAYYVKVSGLSLDSEDILDFKDSTLVLISPQVTAEIDVSGSFEFTVPPNHQFYNFFDSNTIMSLIVEVWEDSVLQWFGRPIELHLDFYNNKKVYCEGALGFFNDSVIRPEEYENTALSTIFAAVIAEHNSMVPESHRFTVGNFTVRDEIVYRKFDYEQTSDVLKSKFLDAVEGHFFVRRENGVNYIDLLKDMPYTCNQRVEFGKNLLNFTYSFDGKDFATCVIPLGANDEETREPITIKSINSNSDILIGNTASNYGNIIKVQHYSDIDDPIALISEGQKYLTNLQWNAFLIECSAIDLHATDQTKQQFQIGQVVQCVSNPHSINIELPISKITLYLDSAAKQITLGRIPKKTLARFYKEHIGTGGTPTDNIDDTLPAGFDIITDPETGDPTLIKVPVSMQIMTLPYRDGSQANSSYEYGDTLIFDGLTAKLVAKGLSRDDPPDTPMTYFSDANYPYDGDIPFNELSFEPTTYNQHAGKLMVWCIWTNPRGLYNGVKFRKAFYMQSLTEAALEAANGPVRIEVVVPPSKLEYYDGEHVVLSGAKVVAYMENGDPYTGNGYSNGVIPLSELTYNPATADKDQALSRHGSDGNGVEVLVVNAVTVTGYYPGASDPYTVYIDQSIPSASDPPEYDGCIGADKPCSYMLTIYNGWAYAKVLSGDNIIEPKRYTKIPYTWLAPNGWYWYGGSSTLRFYSDHWTSVGTDFLRIQASIPVSTADPQLSDDIIIDPATQTITISWTAPNGTVLSDTFSIVIKEGGIYSGR